MLEFDGKYNGMALKYVTIFCTERIAILLG